MNNKRGQGLSLKTIILVVLGLAVLVLLLYGSLAGWDKLMFWVGDEEVNIDSISRGCALVCQQGGSYGFCEQKRNLVTREGETEGSCHDFASSGNPDLNIESCNNLCSVVSDGCVSDGEKDEDCDGVWDGGGDSGDVGAEGDAGLSGDVKGDLSGIAEAKGDGKFNVLSEEECKNGLEKRRERLGIPAKVCYWQTMTKLYDNKCNNLNKEEISKIFEKKEKYRDLNNPDWPNLKSDGDFCVEVVYDCDSWLKDLGGIKKNTQAMVKWADPSRKIKINPFLNFSKPRIDSIIIHEATHSIQNHSGANILNYPPSSLPFDIDALKSVDKELGGLYDKRTLLTKGIKSFIDGWRDADKKSFSSLSGTPEWMERYKAWRDSRSEVLRYSSKISVSAIPVDPLEFVSKENIFYKNFSSNKEYLKLVDELNKFLLGNFTKFGDLLKAYYYTAEVDELDPRLSEVNRWWLDKTAPNCEIVTDPKKAEEIFKAFLADKKISDGYSKSQEELIDVMELAKRKGMEKEVYVKLANRLPGLAYDDSLLDGGDVFA